MNREIHPPIRSVITPKPIPEGLSLDDYWKAPGDARNPDMSSLGYQWDDKPHRLLYDLIAYAMFLEDTLSEAVYSHKRTWLAARASYLASTLFEMEPDVIRARRILERAKGKS